jgi:hypothetical protein
MPFVFNLIYQFTILYLQQRYIKLINSKKYNIGIATFFLVVYAFIATPVQLWHHHNYNVNTACKDTITKKEATSTYKSTYETVVDANCATCSHVYSTYSFTASINFETPLSYTQPKHTSYIVFIPFSPLLHCTNKGPPALMA